jgi:hypothetical protein
VRSTCVCFHGNARCRDVSYYIIVDIHNEKQLFAIISTILDPCNHPQLFESVISSHRRESIIPMCMNSTSNPYTSTANKIGVIFAILRTVLVVTVSLMNGVAHSDPFGWGYTPSMAGFFSARNITTGILNASMVASKPVSHPSLSSSRDCRICVAAKDIEP